MAERARPHPVAVALAAAGLAFYLFTVPLAAKREGDFVHLWVGGHLVASGQGAQLYDRAAQRAALAAVYGEVPGRLWAPRNDRVGLFFYPPPGGLAYAPFGLLPPSAGAKAAALAALAGAVGAAALLRGLAPALSLPARLALILAFPGFFYSFALGQNGIFSLIVLLAGLALVARGRPLGGGVALGLLVAKPSWLVAVAWWPLLLGGPPLAAGMALGAGLSLGLSTAVLGPGPLSDWLGLLPDLMRLPSLPGYPLSLQFNLASLPRRWLVPGLSAELAGGVAAIAVLGITLWRGRARPLAQRGALGLTAATLLNPHLHHYDGLPVLAGLAWILSEAASGEARARWGAAALLIAHHGAFAVMDALGLSAWLPLPSLAALGVWAWLLAARDRPPT